MDGLENIPLSERPAGYPPPGVIPNFNNPPSQGHIPQIVTYVTLPPLAICLVLRFYTRIRMSRLGLDDYLCGLAAGVIVANIALIFVLIDQAAGPHMWDIRLTDITESYAQNNSVSATLYFVASVLIKTAIFVLYLRIFRPSRLANILIWVGIVVTVVFYIVVLALFAAHCYPRTEDSATGGWLSPIFYSRCYKYDGHLSAASGIMGTVIDFYILALPLGFLWGLQASLKRKAGLSAIFISGSAACICSVVGAVYRMRIATSDSQAQDLSWNAMPIYATSVAEINIGIICSCMPVIFVLFKGFSNWSNGWISRLRYQSSNRRKQQNASGSSDIHLANYEGIGRGELPEIPKGTFTGVRSFVRNLNRTKPIASQVETPTVMSINDNYHDQLRQEARSLHSRGPPGSQTNRQ